MRQRLRQLRERLWGGRRVRTPLFLQFETTECGAACLGIILAHFRRWVSLEELRVVCGVSRDACSAADIVRAAEGYGLRVAGWRKEPQHLQQDLPLPAILFWEFNHFVVLEGFSRGRYYLNDPSNGHRTVSEEEFDEAFTGVVLTLERGPTFQPSGGRPGIVRPLWQWLHTVKKPLLFAALCGLLLALPGLALPVLLSVFVDHLLGGGAAASWEGGLIAATGAVAAATYLLTYLQQRCLRKINIRLAVVQADRFLRHLFRLPVQYFAHRFTGDLTARVQLVDKVAGVGTMQFTGVIIELVMSVLFLILMVAYDLYLAAIVVALAATNAVLMRLVSQMRTDENRQMQREQAMMAGLSAVSLRNIESLRAAATEDEVFASWSGYQARELKARQRFAELGYVIAALPTLFLILGGAVVLGLGGWRVIKGDMTIGMLMGFHAVAGNFLRPVGRFVQFADLFQVLEADLQRLNDVFNAPEDALLEKSKDSTPRKIATLDGRLRLAGRIELRAITFGYQPKGKPLIDNLSLTVEPGQRVAVVGPTGSGKSTLLMLVSGVYAPWSGEILFDGVPREGIPRDILTSSVAIVDQRPFLFAGTVRDNLTMWNPTVPDDQLAAASRDALIHDDIMSRVGGYDSAVQEGGRNFSGGQRQRLEIGRALVNNPSVLLLDEATSSLDAVSEERIDDALRRRGCTCFIIAHRLSTIRDCDQIIVLYRGQPVQQGTHEELLADESGLYYQLVHAN